MPKVAGGLNITNIGLWNKAAILKHYWSLGQKKDRLWIKWVHTYYIKGNMMNEVKPKQASWVVQKIFNAGKYIEEAGLTVEEIMSRDMFSIRKMYNNMRGDYPRVHWRRLICNNQSSPRWSFILYMTVQNRLYTRDKLIK